MVSDNNATISHFLLYFYLCLPLNRCLPVRLQIFVGTAEVLVAKETVIGLTGDGCAEASTGACCSL